MRLLEDKVAVIYGGGGSIGGAVARAFADEGAIVHVTGRREGSVTAVVDALDERSIDAHLETVVDEHGRVDISFNAVGLHDQEVLGVPLTDLDVDGFSTPLTNYVTSYFLTARLAARRMVKQKSGVIMTVSALHSRIGVPLVGGYGPAQAAKEALTRHLSAELAQHGVRVVGLRPQGMPESSTIKRAFEPRAKATGVTWEQWQELLASRTHPHRLMTLDEMASTAAFVASDRGSGLTGTTINLTLGSTDD
ncbi:SDR family NAD(P)-dependent oxidoreductase [Nocardioides speluncae]|uniref:SDR family NAD(P)-dependent oxidoreductase n=1 Tax=Nocardioides speluncae TaxID=2670337 RepID=UPI000D68880C|nr:SDR family oxidoreductase [Nocardioides speluncae]